MKISQVILQGVALSLGAALMLPAQNASAWSLLGLKLGLNQRDFRIFNNFTDSVANNNQTPDASFPGHQGAVMSIWKGCIEWGSELHGDGSGDPHQSGGLGSGGANFDASFQGEATEVGDANDNIHSEISGSSGGVLAFTEGSGGSGWRVRYYSSWTWDDGPTASVPSGRIDLQGVACHEYGHALGMGHSNVSGATMRPSISGTGVSARSIHSDDIAGVQANYNVKDGGKPHITSINIAAGVIQITGNNFDATGNQIWFTRGAPGGDGTPIKVTNLDSNGSFLSTPVPAGAGAGDVLVQRDGTVGKFLSNAFPVDLVTTPACTAPVNYCSSLPNSGSAGAQITSSNDSSLSVNNFELVAFGLPAGKPGLFFYGPNQTSAVFGEGMLCIAGSIQRLPIQVTDGLGTALLTLDFSSPPFDSGAGQAIDGGTLNFQFWFRDPTFGPSGF
ncbi:MAG: hypothetical protein ACI9F9_002270, partial [Candidatus Paceibacteria bacterium]